MPGGLMQLLFQGAQDIYLTGNPSMSFFKTVYRRYTPFSTEYIYLPFDTIPSFTPLQETKVSCKIDRNGDLVHDIYLVYDLPAIFTNNEIPFGWVEELGTHIIKEVVIRADGTQLDIMKGEFMKVYTDLTYNGTKKYNYLKCVGGEAYMMNTGKNLVRDITKQQIAINARRLYIPLLFWFNTNPGNSLPLIALQYNVIYIDITFNPLNELIRIGYPLISPKRLFGSYSNSEQNVKIRDYLRSQSYDQTNVFYYFNQNNWQSNTYLLANYIYLGDDERQMFTQASHEYLVQQVQTGFFQGLKQGSNFLQLTFSQPVKELIWALTRDDLDLYNNWYNYNGILTKNTLNWWQRQQPYFGYNNYYIPELNYIELNFNDYMNGLKAETVDKVNNESLQTYFGDYYSIMKSARIIFNNNDRLEVQEKDFYQNLQTYKYHNGLTHEGIYVLSFALRPEDFQPSGTQNMSRLNNQELQVDIFETYPVEQRFNCYVWAVSYNVFRIMGGIGSMVFAN
jgi:hypothetical protein